MFETSVVRARVVAQRRVGVFAASVVAHTVVITGIVAASISSTSFPKNAPNELVRFNVVAPAPEMPLPKGNPNAPRQPQAQPKQSTPASHAQTAPPADATTPKTIPESIPLVASTSTAVDVNPGSGNNSSTDHWGVKDGDENSIDIGQSTNNSVTTPDVVFHPGADVKSAVVLSRVQPAYPAMAARLHLSGWVVVKCIIGKNGEIRDAEVEKSSNAMFEPNALDALRHWKFAPGYYRGQAVDTYFELKITFEVR